MADVVDIRTRRRIRNPGFRAIIADAGRRITQRTGPYGIPIDGGHCRRCDSIPEILRAFADGYEVDLQGSRPTYLLMVKRV